MKFDTKVQILNLLYVNKFFSTSRRNEMVSWKNIAFYMVVNTQKADVSNAKIYKMKEACQRNK